MASLTNILSSPNTFFAVSDGGEADFKNGRTERNLGSFPYNGKNYNVFAEAIVSATGQKVFVLENGNVAITRIQENNSNVLVEPGTETYNAIAALALPIIVRENNQVRNVTTASISNVLKSSIEEYRSVAGNQNYAVESSATLEPYGGFTGIGNNLIGATDNKGFLSYPLAMPLGMDRMAIDVYQYAPRGARQNRRGTIQGNVLKTIYLPIPRNLVDGNKVNWQDASIGEFGETLINAATTLVQGDLSGLKDAFERSKNVLKDKKLLQSGAAALAINAVGGSTTLAQILGYTTGAILNPNVELMFTGVSLRDFNFRFDMYAQNALEGQTIKNIIGYLKYAMAAKVSEGEQSYLKVPYIFKPRFLQGGNRPHPGLGLIKPCALKNITVDYNSQAYSTFLDGTQQVYTMTLNFTEMEVVYDVDYQENGAQPGVGGNIGY